ncbi:MAG: hypothetical protein ACRCUM_03150 [Mycoplasmoidaceae bacterium]
MSNKNIKIKDEELYDYILDMYKTAAIRGIEVEKKIDYNGFKFNVSIKVDWDSCSDDTFEKSQKRKTGQ